MTDSKHTPGEWFTHREGFSTVYVEARICGGLIQEVAACGPTAEGSEQQEANARLIAAAPELLEALKMMVTTWEHGGVDVYPIAEARAAITKATGN